MIFISNIKKYWEAILLALAIGFVILLPTLLSIQKIGLSQFKGVYPVLSDDEDHYNTLTREVYDGHFKLSNPYLKEHKNDQHLFFPIPEIAGVFLAKVLGISVATMAVVNDFFLPAICVLLMYSLFLKVTGSKKSSIVLSSLFFLMFISTFNRPVSPQFHFIFLLWGLNLVWSIVTQKFEAKKSIRYNFLLAIVFGVLVYAYPFYWMTIGIVYTLWVILVAYKDKDYKYWLKGWLWFFVPAVVSMIPFLVNNFLTKSNPFFIENNLRMGFITTHIPGAFSNVAFMIWCLPIAYLYFMAFKDKKTASLPGILIVSGVLLNWQNIIVGQTFQFPQHFYSVIVLFIFIIFGLSLQYFKEIRFKVFPIKTLIPAFMFIVLFISILNKQEGEILQTFKNISNPIDISRIEKFGGTLSWLNDNTPKDSTVYVLGEEINAHIPIYTHNNVYFLGNAGLSLISDIEVENRWAILHFFDKVDEKYIKEQERGIWTNKFLETYQSLESRRKILQLITGKTYPETDMGDKFYIERTLNSYKHFQDLGFEKAIKTYAVDYVIVDEYQAQYKGLPERLKSYKFLTFLQKIEDVSIYKVN